MRCILAEVHRGEESTEPTEECKAACDQVHGCIAIGTHYFCDRIYFHNYEEGLANAPEGMCISWEYTEVSGPIACEDIDAGKCGASVSTNGCWVRVGKFCLFMFNIGFLSIFI